VCRLGSPLCVHTSASHFVDIIGTPTVTPDLQSVAP